MQKQHSRRAALKGVGLLVSGFSAGCLGVQSRLSPATSTTPSPNEQVESIKILNKTTETRTATITIFRGDETVHEETFDIKPWKVKDSVLIQGAQYLHGAYLDEVGDYRLGFEVGDQQIAHDVFEPEATEADCYRAIAEILPRTEDEFQLYIGSYASPEFCGYLDK